MYILPDIDECAVGPAEQSPCQGMCTNYIGGFQCQCPLGEELAPGTVDCVGECGILLNKVE